MKIIRFLAALEPRWRIGLGFILLLLILFPLFPFKTTIVPAWDLTVVDDTGVPVPAINVTEHWQHNLLETEGHEELKSTLADGRASFPARTIRASIVSRAISYVGKIFSEGRKARVDPHASVVVWGSKTHETTVAVYTEGSGLQTTIVAPRSD